MENSIQSSALVFTVMIPIVHDHIDSQVRRDDVAVVHKEVARFCKEGPIVSNILDTELL